MPPGQQCYKRTKMVLPLRLWTDEEDGQTETPQLAHTVNISPIGARLGGLPKPLQSGQVITLQRGKNRNKFRVVWTKQIGGNEIRAGIEALEPGKKIWDINLPDEPISENSTNAPAGSRNAGSESLPTGSRSSAPKSKVARIPKSNLLSGVRFRLSPKVLRMRWMLAVACLIIVGSVALLQWLSPQSVETASAPLPPPIMKPVSAPAAVTKFKDTVRVIFGQEKSASKTSDTSARVRVAEVPQGRIVYPDPPPTNLSGKVNLKVVIGMAGRVKEIWVLSGNRELAQAAIEAVRQWRYNHHEQDGRAIEAETNVTIDFQGQDAVSIRFPSSNPANSHS